MNKTSKIIRKITHICMWITISGILSFPIYIINNKIGIIYLIFNVIGIIGLLLGLLYCYHDNKNY